MNYIGIDPSWTCTGIVCLNPDSVQGQTHGTIRFSRSKKTKPWTMKVWQPYKVDRKEIVEADLGDIGRMVALHEEIHNMFRNLCVQNDCAVGIEVPMGLHAGAGAKVERAYAAIALAVEDRVEWFRVYTPGQIKKFTTGKGNAKKELMMKEAYKRWGFETESHDVADAYAIARLVEHDYTQEANND